MVLLFDIKYEAGRLSCKYTAENSLSEGYVVYEKDSDTFPVEQKSDFDRDKKTYLRYVKRGLRAIVKEGPPYPEKYGVMWY